MPQPFQSAVITNAGANLLTRAQAGELSIEFTRIAIGDGTYTKTEKEVPSLQAQDTLKSEKNSYPLSNVEICNEHSVKVTALITNQDPATQETLISSGYFINEMRLFAKVKDGDSDTEVLYSIAVTTGETGDFMPPYNGHYPAQIIQEYYATVNNSAEVIIQSGVGAVALADDLQNGLKQLREEIPAAVRVKGDAESAYRTGDVNLTPENIGAVAKSGDTMTGELVTDGGIKYVGKNSYIAYPDDGYINMQSASTNNLGFLKITLPVSWSITMLKFVVSIYDYFTGETTDYHISGYNYSAEAKWTCCTATCVGKAGAYHSNLPVSFGHDGTKCAVTIGNSDTSWHYPIAKVHDILLGHFNTDFSKWKAGWTISVSTEPLITISETINNTHVAYGGISSSCTGNAESANYLNIIRGNELRFGGLNGKNDAIYMNYRLPNNELSETAVTRYKFCNGRESTVGVTIEASEFSGNAASATKATQDGNGKVIADTYAKKNIYGDTTVSLGRKIGSTVGTQSAAVGGKSNIASGECSAAVGGGFNEASGLYSATVGGTENTASSSYSVAIGGEYSTASGMDSAVIGGKGLSAENDYSTAFGRHNAHMATGTAFVIGNGTSASTLSNAFSVMFNGIVKAKSTITGSTTADYAEFFEWLDGNPNNEDRVGRFVTLTGNKIKIASSNSDYILGIVSGEPFVLGNGDCDTWNGMYMKDDFNRTIYEPAPKMELDEETGDWVSVVDENGNLVYEGTRPKLNPRYDPDQPYISRFDRKEWSPVGMLGVLSVIDDGSCQVDGFCCCSTDGIATACEKETEGTYRVTERVSKNVVRVVLK